MRFSLLPLVILMEMCRSVEGVYGTNLRCYMRRMAQRSGRRRKGGICRPFKYRTSCVDLPSNSHGVGGVSQLSTVHCSNCNAVTSDYGSGSV